MNKKKASYRLSIERKVFSAVSPLVEKMCEPPKMKNIKRALFIQPHPDDNQIAAGGTIAWLIDQGVEVFELTVLDDRYIDLAYTGEGLTVRQKEALAAQACLGMKNAGFLGFGDRTEASAREISKAIVSVIREVKPDAVFFGEMIPPAALERADQVSRSCDLMLVVGTSAMVYPAASMPGIAKEHGATVVEINPAQTPLTGHISEYILLGPAGDVLVQLVERITALA